MAGLYFRATGFVFQRDEQVSFKDFSTKLTVSAHRHKREVQGLSWRHAKALLVVISALVFGASLTPALNGCAGDRSGAERVAQAIGVDPYRLDDDGARELARFNHVFTTYADNPSDIRELKQFRDVYKRIRANYVTPVDDTALIDAALKGVVESDAAPGRCLPSSLVDTALEAMTASLDPHSAYLDPEALKESELVTTGEFGGLGIQVTQDGDKIKVISPIEGTPAERAGVQPGDLITHLDRKAITGMSLREAVHAMRGAPGTPILLTLKRGEKQPSTSRSPATSSQFSRCAGPWRKTSATFGSPASTRRRPMRLTRRWRNCASSRVCVGWFSICATIRAACSTSPWPSPTRFLTTA